jgi:hypothetical protein
MIFNMIGSSGLKIGFLLRVPVSRQVRSRPRSSGLLLDIFMKLKFMKLSKCVSLEEMQGTTYIAVVHTNASFR